MFIMIQAIENKSKKVIISALSALLVMASWSVPVLAQDATQAQLEPQVVLEDPGQAELARELDPGELEDLVGPIALYPDDLVAIVLPAATYPLQIVEAARFLDDLELDATLKPDEDWDDSVVALLNYPEVVRMLNDDLDWTWRLGNAVLTQQDDVVQAIGHFRDRAYAAGNLKTDEKQNVLVEEGVIEITPADPEVIYVPYYEPARVVVVQSTPAYYYYPYAYPLYYYPYPAAYSFSSGFFWGVATAYTIGWYSHCLNVHYPYYYSHPYYNYPYYRSHYVRYYPPHRGPAYPRPPHGQSYNSHDRYSGGDRWQAGNHAASRPVRWSGASPQNSRGSVASNGRVVAANTNRNRSGEQISASYRNAFAQDSSLRRITNSSGVANSFSQGASTRGAGWKERTVSSDPNRASSTVRAGSSASANTNASRPDSHDARNWRAPTKQPVARSTADTNTAANSNASSRSASQRSSQITQQVRSSLEGDTRQRLARAGGGNQGASNVSASGNRTATAQGNTSSTRNRTVAAQGNRQPPAVQSGRNNTRPVVSNESRSQTRPVQVPVQREAVRSAPSRPEPKASPPPAPAKAPEASSRPQRQSQGSSQRSGNSKPRGRPH